MKSRLSMVIVAVALALMATLGVMIYIQGVRAQIKEESTPVEVVVSRQAIAKGTPVETMKLQNMLEVKKIPKRYTTENTYSSLPQLDDQVAIVDISQGEQLTNSMLKKTSQAGLAHQIPEGLVAVSVPVDEVIGVSGQVEQGDHLNVIATFSPGPGGADASRTLLQNIEVLYISSDTTGTRSSARIGKTSAQGSQKKTMVLAISPNDAEKLVFAEEKGTVWFTLVPPNNPSLMNTDGRTIDSVYE
jgi:pilus assembly protein CpaB